MRVDVLALDQVVLDQDVRDAVEQCEVGARPERQEQVGHHRGLGDARVRDDQGLLRVRLRMYWHRIGWLSAMLAPISRTTSAFSMSS